MSTKKNRSLTSTYYVNGMHCASCEILIEKLLRKEPGVISVDAVLSKGIVTFIHDRKFNLTPDYLNTIFADDGYTFSRKPFGKKSGDSQDTHCAVEDTNPVNWSQAGFLALVFILGYTLLSKTGLSSLISVNSSSSLPLFFLFGLLAGISSCAALVGGIVLSLSRQWLSLYNTNSTFVEKAQPHFLFNAGRVGGYAVFGALLGMAGNFFKLSPAFTSILVIAISIVMVLLGLQMIGVKALKNFQVRLPKSLTGHFADETNFQGRYAPLLMGALTFFLPCGFTITAQALALASGSPIQGAAIMGLFALGTAPGLLAIGLSSVKFNSNPATARQFSLIAGMIVLFFAAFNINSQLSVLGVANINDIVSGRSAVSSASSAELPPLVNGVQVVRIEAAGYEYTPSHIRLRANTPTRWEVNAVSVSGCTNAIISRGLFDGQIDLVNGQTAVKEFTSPAPGVYKYSCWMGMVTGTVEVVDSSGSTGTSNAAPVESGAKGCGCGGGGGRTCGGI